jgi:hypothetical protein
LHRRVGVDGRGVTAHHLADRRGREVDPVEREIDEIGVGQQAVDGVAVGDDDRTDGLLTLASAGIVSAGDDVTSRTVIGIIWRLLAASPRAV